MSSKLQNEPDAHNKILTWQVALVGLVVLGGLAFMVQRWLFADYAQETLMPLGASLERDGGVKKCGRGDTGRGWDNMTPWYYAIYEFKGDQSSTVKLVLEDAKRYGYDLKEYQPDITRDDKTSVFYKDFTSKKSEYPDLESGNIKLDITFYNNKGYVPGPFCTMGALTGKTTALITLTLPQYKQR